MFQMVLFVPRLFALALAFLVLIALPASTADPVQERPGDRAVGSLKAPIVMIEYYSLDCSYCAKFHTETYPRLKREYIDTGLMRFVYRDFPLSWAALEAAILTHCVSPERFFAVFDMLLEAQSRWIQAESTAKAVARIGETQGVTSAQYQACLDERKWERQIYLGQKYASEVLGVTATPTFFINGEKLEGNIAFDTLAKGLDHMLNEIQRKSPDYTFRVQDSEERGLWDHVPTSKAR